VNQSGPENAILQLSFFMFFSKKNTSEILGQWYVFSYEICMI
jgi:hypothetical protein